VEDLVDARTEEIRSALKQLARRMRAGHYSEILHWVVPDGLACGQRPLRHHALYGGSGKNIEPAAAPLVREWTARLQLIGIRSIISLMHTRDLSHYAGLDLGAPTLLDFYKARGLEVAHLPWEDPHHSKTSSAHVRKKLRAVRGKALQEYRRLPKPVLVQCSAGIDRTAPVAAYISVMIGTPR
jgi:hypothetical protein